MTHGFTKGVRVSSMYLAWFYKGGKCLCFVLVNKWHCWGQSALCAIRMSSNSSELNLGYNFLHSIQVWCFISAKCSYATLKFMTLTPVQRRLKFLPMNIFNKILSFSFLERTPWDWRRWNFRNPPFQKNSFNLRWVHKSTGPSNTKHFA